MIRAQGGACGSRQGRATARLADSLARHQAADPETLADALLADLLAPGGATDDTALVIVRL